VRGCGGSNLPSWRRRKHWPRAVGRSCRSAPMEAARQTWAGSDGHHHRIWRFPSNNASNNGSRAGGEGSIRWGALDPLEDMRHAHSSRWADPPPPGREPWPGEEESSCAPGLFF
jgi:hypothetical protein